MSTILDGIALNIKLKNVPIEEIEALWKEGYDQCLRYCPHDIKPILGCSSKELIYIKLSFYKMMHSNCHNLEGILEFFHPLRLDKIARKYGCQMVIILPSVACEVICYRDRYDMDVEMHNILENAIDDSSNIMTCVKKEQVMDHYYFRDGQGDPIHHSSKKLTEYMNDIMQHFVSIDGILKHHNLSILEFIYAKYVLFNVYHVGLLTLCSCTVDLYSYGQVCVKLAPFVHMRLKGIDTYPILIAKINELNDALDNSIREKHFTYGGYKG